MLDGLKVGGVGRVIGRAEKAGRRSEEDFLIALDTVVREAPDLCLLHQGPSGARHQPGHDAVNAALASFRGVVVCGHVHWEQPRSEVRDGPQVLNVDGRVVILRQENPSR